ncbi:alpha-ketoacid dehydrogenase subunit beta, partial [Pseudonocardia sp.]
GNGNAAQHSDTAYPALMNLGGIRVAVPTTAADAKGLFTTAVRGHTPTFFLEAAGRGGELGEVPDGEHLVAFGQAATLREGRDVTVVAIGTMVRPTLRAAEALAGDGISAEVIDPRTLVPLDEDAILASVARTGRLVVVDEARDRCSAASQIAAVVADRGFTSLRAPVRRVTVPDVALPYARNAESALIPSPERIADAVRHVTARQYA